MTTPKKKRRLGRGLSSLMQDPVNVDTQQNPKYQTSEESVDSGRHLPGLEWLSPGSIVPNRHQPRQSFSEEDLDALADSIRRSGLMQPVVVRPGDAGRFELVAGERRWRAAKLAGLESIPAVVRELSDELAAEWALAENVQRRDLNPMEKAFGLRRMCEQFNLTHQEVAERIGLQRSTVTNLVRLTELEERIRAMVASEELSMGHARALLACAPGPDRVDLADRIVRESWSVRKAEAAISATSKAPRTLTEADLARTANLRDLEKQLSEHLGTKVAIRTNRDASKGRVVVDFYDRDQFDGLMQAFGFQMS